MLTLRSVSEGDLDFITWVDLRDEGITKQGGSNSSEADFAHRRRGLATYAAGDADSAWILEEPATSRRVGLIMCRFRDLAAEPPSEANQFLLRYLPRDLFPMDGRFAEITQLWVDPAFRRRGLASNLKRQVEVETRHRSISAIYTHTEAKNVHVIEMNLKLGYKEVRRGPIWNDVVRVSLIKDIS